MCIETKTEVKYIPKLNQTNSIIIIIGSGYNYMLKKYWHLMFFLKVVTQC